MPKKVKRKNKKTTKIIIAIIIAILIALVTFFCLRIFTEKNNLDTQNITSENPQKSKSQQKAESNREITIESTDIKKEDGVRVEDEDDPNNSEIITGSIARASKTSDGTIFRIIATMDQALSDGECELTFSNSFKTLTLISKITAHPNSAACTFDLNSQEITSGEWNILVKIVTTNERFGIIEDSVEIKE